MVGIPGIPRVVYIQGGVYPGVCLPPYYGGYTPFLVYAPLPHPGYTYHTSVYPGVPIPTDLGVMVYSDEALGSRRGISLGGRLSGASYSRMCEACYAPLRVVTPAPVDKVREDWIDIG